jgi:Protein of unknwon function (DUF3310)
VDEEFMGERRGSDVHHPPHYPEIGGVLCVDVTERLPCNVGTAVKYVWRHGLKGDARVKDLKKAAWYLTRECERERVERNEFAPDDKCAALIARVCDETRQEFDLLNSVLTWIGRTSTRSYGSMIELALKEVRLEIEEIDPGHDGPS